MDYLTDPGQDDRIKEIIFYKYPELNNGKKNLLYVPTFRDTDEDIALLNQATDDLIKAVNYSEYNLIVKHHVVDSDLEEVYVDSHTNKKTGESFIGMELMSVCDYVISDYSSIIYEALLKNRRVYLYCFDSDKYIDERGFYIDYEKDIPALYSKTAKGICKLISDGNTVDEEKISAFKEDYVNKRFDSITSVYGEIIDELIKGEYDERYNYRNINLTLKVLNGEME